MISHMMSVHGPVDVIEYDKEADFVASCRGWDTIDSHIYPDHVLVVQVGICNFIGFKYSQDEDNSYDEWFHKTQDEALNWILTNIRNKDIEINWFGLRVKISNIEVYRDTIRTYDRG